MSEKFKPHRFIKCGYLLVFQVPYRNKLENSLLYSPDYRIGDFTRCGEETWVISEGRNCNMNYKPGMRSFVRDAFELDDFGYDEEYWDYFKNKDEFKSLRDFVERVDGVVVTKICPENALLCEVT